MKWVCSICRKECKNERSADAENIAVVAHCDNCNATLPMKPVWK